MGNDKGERVVARFRDGRLVKGYIGVFSVESDTLLINDLTTNQQHHIPIDNLKAVYFVKTFKGISGYVEKKAYGIRKHKGRKVFIKFTDKETLVGYIEGEIPWDEGFSLEKLGKKAKGFFITPVDEDSNNDKVFVVGSAIDHVQIVMV